MKKKQRRLAATLALVVMVVFASQTMAGGSLEPSAAPGVTMKSLDEVQPRIPIQSLSGDPNAVYVINQSGSYYFTGGITVTDPNKDGIRVDVNDITIDLMGYALKGTDSVTRYGVYMNGRSNVEIRNGTVRNFIAGILEQDTALSRDHRVIDVRAISNGLCGIYLGGTNHLVKDCTASDNADSATVDTLLFGILAGSGSTVTGNTAYNNGRNNSANTWGIYGIWVGNGSTVTGNTAYDNGNNSGSTWGIYGILAGSGSTVTGNMAYENGNLASESFVYGIAVGSGSTVTGNTAYENGNLASGSSFVFGIAAGEGSTVTGNTAYENGFSASESFVFGICSSQGSTVTGNTAYENGNLADQAYGIDLGAYNLVDQNTVYSNGTGAVSATNMELSAFGCVYGNNVAPLVP